MHYLIIGNGVAGTTAAEQIRKHDARGAVTVLSEEEFPFYSRIRLADYLAGRVEERGLILRDDRWHADRNIRLRLGCRVSRIDAEARRVWTEQGEAFPYDRLLLATGGTSFMPPIAGGEKTGVFTLRSLADAIRIKHFAGRIHEALLIGGGVLGLEAGLALRQAGCAVRVVEICDRLLPRQLDRAGSRLLERQLTAMGLRFELGGRVRELSGDHRVRGIVLEDGRRFPCELVIVSAGMRTRCDLAAALDLEVGRGVMVDDRLATSVPHIYAAGDAAEHRQTIYGFWMAARNQGEVAGINMAGGEARFEGMVPTNVFKVAGVELAALGDFDPEDRHEAFVDEHPEQYRYRKLVFAGDRLVGAILYGDLGDRFRIAGAIESGREITPEMKEQLARGNLKVLG